MIKKTMSILIFILIIIAGYSQKDQLLHWMRAGGSLSICISMLFVAITVFFPVVPFPVLGGIIGAIFGMWEGAAISLAGAMLGTTLLFFLVRYGFRDWAQNYVQKYPKIKEYEQYFENNSFLAILLSRVIPVIPAAVVNIICGLSNVRWWTFFWASVLGKIPNILLVNFAGSHFLQNKWFSIGIYGVYLLIIFIINYIVLYKKMAKSQES
ncbi:TVP38/TMEM64 family protein [Aneurinibacillus sp. Ricciae_BoGa-3]|uniref:TVP38/TMEM64 family protein n=1 Tax=Aneurinibacillus sp. Ricciae_BoGa-3 TaxID=3022697 RepID=UPI00233F94FA|nr:TVP38/TMEM64 family protein [Aneurinibacillus sp. Ricciae_BoGa-3]WCK56547.1 TVP38/TMEM64 family protein [Aneurinibacillus sp. Ricciae_BoGa-3]